MKTIVTSAFVLIITATSSFAWGEGCASKNKSNFAGNVLRCRIFLE